MLTWLLGIVVFVVLWAGLWRSQPKAAFGVLLGLPIAFQLEVIRETGADLRVPGEVLRVLGL